MRCLGCDYVLSGVRDMRCPECGRTFDPDRPSTYGPLDRKAHAPNRRLHRWACAAALLPLVFTVAERGLGRALYRVLTSGLKAGDTRFDDAWSLVGRVILWTHWGAAPAVAMLFLFVGARWRWPGLGNVVALIPPMILFAALSVVGFVVLIPRYFSH